MSRLDPLGDLRRTQFCGEVRASDVGREIVCAAGCASRDHGGVSLSTCATHGSRAGRLQAGRGAGAHTKDRRAGEWVLAVRGVLARREADAANPNLPTGEVELVAHEVRIVNTATDSRHSRSRTAVQPREQQLKVPDPRLRRR